jgi:hypothetical protein
VLATQLGQPPLVAERPRVGEVAFDLFRAPDRLGDSVPEAQASFFPYF